MHYYNWPSGSQIIGAENDVTQLGKSAGIKVSNLKPVLGNGSPSHVRIQESHSNLINQMRFG